MVTEDQLIHQIEYFLNQSAQGHHFLFHKEDIVTALSPLEHPEFSNWENREKVQKLLSQILEKESYQERRVFLESLPPHDYQLFIRAYFRLVDNAILARNKLKH